MNPSRAVVAHRGLALALAHLAAVGIQDERQVGEDRRLGPEGAEQQDVLGHVAEVILAPDDVADPHRHVVDDVREVEQRGAVGADDHEVAAERLGGDLDVAADHVVERDDLLADAEPDHRPPALGLEARRAPSA